LLCERKKDGRVALKVHERAIVFFFFFFSFWVLQFLQNSMMRNGPVATKFRGKGGCFVRAPAVLRSGTVATQFRGKGGCFVRAPPNPPAGGVSF
jgi:hypothetical protein